MQSLEQRDAREHLASDVYEACTNLCVLSSNTQTQSSRLVTQRYEPTVQLEQHLRPPPSSKGDIPSDFNVAHNSMY